MNFCFFLQVDDETSIEFGQKQFVEENFDSKMFSHLEKSQLFVTNLVFCGFILHFRK